MITLLLMFFTAQQAPTPVKHCWESVSDIVTYSWVDTALFASFGCSRPMRANLRFIACLQGTKFTRAIIWGKTPGVSEQEMKRLENTQPKQHVTTHVEKSTGTITAKVEEIYPPTPICGSRSAVVRFKDRDITVCRLSNITEHIDYYRYVIYNGHGRLVIRERRILKYRPIR
jgi:hypothetical protein